MERGGMKEGRKRRRMERGGMKEGWRKGGVLRGSWVGGRGWDSFKFIYVMCSCIEA